MALAVVVTMAMSGCDNKDDGKLSTDLVTSPKSASEVVSYSFHFTNTGNMPLIITEVGSSCGCTVGDYPHEPVAPGKKGDIKVTYDSKGHHGFQSRSLTVMSNTNPAKTILRIKGTVQTPDQY